ncbi:hypothetical protein AVEN_129758-1 [Araneus ventricosus]|uniref:Histone-lysine N-methyltransferase SETMAR n=1 Tax=Araneus ventricosus TaxID=182803 RepID=A0A4Y2NSC2_ARAVE|nr:hypothetical protein AVEN_129758-1 [Araneus ventricosus]
MQDKGESLMGQDRVCRPCDTISPILGDECVLMCPLMCGDLQYRPKSKPLEAFCHSYSLMISVRSFGTHGRLFPALKSALLERHFRSNEEVQEAVRNFLRLLGTDLYQDGFLNLISRYDKCNNVGGEYVGK